MQRNLFSKATVTKKNCFERKKNVSKLADPSYYFKREGRVKIKKDISV